MLTADYRRWTPAILLSVLALVLVAGCADDDARVEPPQIPPASTFVMDFSDFTESGNLRVAPAEREYGGAAASKLNRSWAAGNVFVWNTLITVGLAVPVAAFLESFNHEPVQETDGTWVWSYNFHAATVLHLARLKGRVTGDSVEWEMYVSKQGVYSDFLWYSGESNLTVTEGTWTINSDPLDPYPLLGILWHRNPAEGTADIRYTNIVPGGPENGGFISYGVTADDPFDAFYEIYNKGLDNYTDIEWNRATNDGRVSDPKHFGDSDWHCWDTDLDDVVCP